MIRAPSLFLASLAMLTVASAPRARADIELPRGSLAGCPFIHEDQYDLNPLLETLKTQLEARIQGKNNCLQSMQSIYTNLNSLQFFYKNIDPAMKQRLASGVYANAILDLEQRKSLLEATGKTDTLEFSSVLSEISQLKSLNLENEIDLKYTSAFSTANQEALFRSQMLSYTSSLLNAYTATARTSPQCIDALGGWNQALAALLGGFSVATGVGLNPTSQILGASASAAVQLINLLKDSKVRSSYNDLIRLKNYKTLACTYYAIQRSTCEYRRAYKVSEQVSDLRRYFANQFDSRPASNRSLRSEYERYFVNLGRIARMGEIFRGIAQIGSALTLNQDLLSKYFTAKAVNFVQLGDPPDEATATEAEISRWLIAARAAGISYSENEPFSGSSLTPQEQLVNAKKDVKAKKATIAAVDKILLQNKSFLDTRRYLSATFPAALAQVNEMQDFVEEAKKSPMIHPTDQATLEAAETLLSKLSAFLSVVPTDSLTVVPKAIMDDSLNNYELVIIKTGADIFQELAKGAIAQLTTTQSAFALSEKGVERLTWAFRVIQNAYLDRDRSENLPADRSFVEYSKKYNILAKVIEDYNSFNGTGSTFRSEDYLTAVKSFKTAFRQEMLKSLELAAEEGIPELKGVTQAHLCALYAPTLRQISEKGLFGGGRASRILYACEEQHKTLQSNHLVADRDFTIDYDDDCTYINYSREREIQSLIAQLIRQ